MPSKRLTIIVLSLMFLLLPARDSSAYWNWIWELSGPGGFNGITYYCKSSPDNIGRRCDEQGFLIFGSGEVKGRTWMKFTATGLWSVPDEDFPDHVYWLSIEPTLERKILKKGRLMLYGGAGLSYNAFAGGGFRAFDRFGWKVTPIAAEIQIRNDDYLLLGLDLRYFPTRFVPEDFGRPARTVPDGGEWVPGAFISYIWRGL